MNTKDFYSFYDLKDITIHEIKDEGDDFIILFDADVEMELMANGFRGGFDLSFLQQATFLNTNSNTSLKEPIHISKYEFKGDKLLLIANDKEITIPLTEVKIKRIKTNHL